MAIRTRVADFSQAHCSRGNTGFGYFNSSICFRGEGSEDGTGNSKGKFTAPMNLRTSEDTLSAGLFFGRCEFGGGGIQA